jgi:site-specific DNA recombinase
MPSHLKVLGPDAEEALPVVAYCRASTDEDTQRYSLDGQEKKNRQYAEFRNWTLVDLIQEYASGANVERPGLTQLRRLVRSGKVKAVVVLKVDRLTRSLFDLMSLVREFDEHGVGLISVTENFDTSTPMGRMIMQMLGMFAEFERELIKERLTGGLRRQAERGDWAGGTPFGYRMGTRKGSLEIVEEEAPLVRRIFQLYVDDGLGFKAIAKRLDDEGRLTRNKHRWTQTAVNNVIGNPAYIGEIHRYGQVYKGNHTPLISKELYERAAQLRKARTRVMGKPPSAPSDFLLSNLVRCGDCGRPMVGTCAKSGQYRYYTCRGRLDHLCNADRVEAGSLDDKVLQALQEALGSPDFLSVAFAQAQTLVDGGDAERVGELANLDEELAKATRARDRLRRILEEDSEDDFDARSFRDEMNAISLRLRSLEERRSQVAAELANEEEANLRELTAVPDLAKAITIARAAEGNVRLKGLVQASVKEVRIDGQVARPVFRLLQTVQIPESPMQSASGKASKKNLSGLISQTSPVRMGDKVVAAAGLEPATFGL